MGFLRTVDTLERESERKHNKYIFAIYFSQFSFSTVSLKDHSFSLEKMSTHARPSGILKTMAFVAFLSHRNPTSLLIHCIHNPERKKILNDPICVGVMHLSKTPKALFTHRKSEVDYSSNTISLGVFSNTPGAKNTQPRQ